MSVTREGFCTIEVALAELQAGRMSVVAVHGDDDIVRAAAGERGAQASADRAGKALVLDVHD